MHGPGAHQGRLQPADLAQAPARGHPLRRRTAQVGAAVPKADDRRLDPQGAGVPEEAERLGRGGIRNAAGGGRSQAVPRHVRARRSTGGGRQDRRSRAAGGPRVRVYTPAGPGPKPALIYFHGGGWVLGWPETIDGPCRRLANASGCVVISVDYAARRSIASRARSTTASRRPVCRRACGRCSGWTPGGSPWAATVPGATWRRPSRSWRATGAAPLWRFSSWSTR